MKVRAAALFGSLSVAAAALTIWMVKEGAWVLVGAGLLTLLATLQLTVTALAGSMEIGRPRPSAAQSWGLAALIIGGLTAISLATESFVRSLILLPGLIVSLAAMLRALKRADRAR